MDGEDFTAAEQEEIVTVLINGFRDKVKTLVLLKSPKNLEQVLVTAKEVKALEVSSEGTFNPVVAVLKDTIPVMMQPVVADINETNGLI